MLFGILADLVLLLHLLWIGFLIFGALLFRRSKGGKVFHGLGLIAALGMQLLSLDCPLTLLEQWLRYRYSPRLTYEGSFITHWAAKIVYLDISPSLVTRLTLLLIGITISLYVWGWLRFQRNRRPS
ncbi:MAG: DUF2784 family protein [Nitrospinae bacterium]|nr:DUF2784 family protein [Nitrospinota bacterium]